MTDRPRRSAGRLIVVVGGQFGSEGKGHLCAQLSRQMVPESLVIRTGGPNAGHTVVAEGVEHKLRHLPTPIAMREDIGIALAAKSVVNPAVLRDEMKTFPDRDVFIDPAATILEPHHILHEGESSRMADIGSTRKGIGVARADRVERIARTARDLWGIDGTEIDHRIHLAAVGDLALNTLAMGRDVLIEAAQGYGLGLHTEYYPYCTSDDCTAIDALAAARISPWSLGIQPEVWMAIRPYPIRVAGTSGPLRGETTWQRLGLPEERTTVTNKVRRVGSWDTDLAQRAAWANGSHGGAVRIGLMMADQVVPEIAGMTSAGELTNLMYDVANPNYAYAGQKIGALLDRVTSDTGCPIGALGTGPDTMIFAAEAGMEGL